MSYPPQGTGSDEEAIRETRETLVSQKRLMWFLILVAAASVLVQLVLR